MQDSAPIRTDFRQHIIDEPESILEDREIMQALVAANGDVLGQNVVDLRGIALERMETRLARLEDTHRSVIAAAYENLAGTNQIHRAVLRLLDPVDFGDFLATLAGDLAQVLNVDVVRLVLETVQDDEVTTSLRDRVDNVLVVLPKGATGDYVNNGRQGQVRGVTLRQIRPENPGIYGDKAVWVRSEACLHLDFGEGRMPGLLLLGAEDPHKFRAGQGTDLLGFFGGVVERAMRRWLA